MQFNKTFFQVSLPFKRLFCCTVQEKEEISQPVDVPNNWWICKSKINQWNLHRSPQADALAWTRVSRCQEESFIQSVSEYYVNKKNMWQGVYCPLKNSCILQEAEGNNWAASKTPDNLGTWTINSIWAVLFQQNRRSLLLAFQAHPDTRLVVPIAGHLRSGDKDGLH